MNTNSLIAYESIKPTLTKRESEVLQVIKDNPGITIRDVAKEMSKRTGIEVSSNQISGRFGKLEEKGAIEIIGTHYYPGSIQPHSKYRVI